MRSGGAQSIGHVELAESGLSMLLQSMTEHNEGYNSCIPINDIYRGLVDKDVDHDQNSSMISPY